MGQLCRIADQRIQRFTARLSRRLDHWNRGGNSVDVTGGEVGRLRAFTVSDGNRNVDHCGGLADLYNRRGGAIDLVTGASRQREDLSHPTGFRTDRGRGDYRSSPGHYGRGRCQLLGVSPTVREGTTD